MKTTLDDLDRGIVKLLMEDARMPCSDIARSLGYVTARTVSNRIRRLVENDIIKLTVVANPAALGYGIAADIDVEVEPRRLKEAIEALTKLELVSYVASVAGDRDVTISVRAADVQALQTFITETLHTIPGVQRTKTFILMEVVKDIYEWQIPDELP